MGKEVSSADASNSLHTYPDRNFVLAHKPACNCKFARSIFILQLTEIEDYFLCNTQISQGSQKERNTELTDYLEHTSLVFQQQQLSRVAQLLT